MSEMDAFEDQELYSNILDGSFGRFSAGDSFPLEFVLSTIPAHRLNELTFAREIAPRDVDFDLLMQRDIDEERVRKKMQPYLSPRGTSGEAQSRARFFPPLLVAIVPVIGRDIQQYYPDLDATEVSGQVVRTWPGVFKVQLKLATGLEPYELSRALPGADEGSWPVKREPARLRYKPAQGQQLGAKLVVVDGQHRLAALRSVDERLLEHLAVPICVVFPPFSTDQMATQRPDQIPTVPEVFRTLFVDVNNTAELVGGHFNILLSEDSIGSLACRKFCSHVLSSQGAEGLAVIEWNTKSRKDSTIINRPYSVASIGVIEKALSTSLKKHLERALNLAEVRDELYGDVGDDDDLERPNPIKWDTFSLDQKRVLEAQLTRTLVPALEDLFFRTRPFSDAVNCFKEAIAELRRLAEIKDAEGNASQQVLNQILEYNPIASRKDDALPEQQYIAFLEDVRTRREGRCHPAIGYAVFQRGIIDAWAIVIDGTRGFDLSAREAMALVRFGVEEQLVRKPNVVNPARSYCQDLLYRGANVRPQEKARMAFGRLMLSSFGARTVAAGAVERLELDDEIVANRLTEALEGLGRDSAFRYIGLYEEARKSRFKSEYLISDELDSEEKEGLANAERELSDHLGEVKTGRRRKEDVSDSFDRLVQGHVRRYVEVASSDLKRDLDYEGDILPAESEGRGDDDDSGEDAA